MKIKPEKKKRKQTKTFNLELDLNPGTLHWYHRGHGYGSCPSLNFFKLYFHNCLSCIHNYYIRNLSCCISSYLPLIVTKSIPQCGNHVLQEAVLGLDNLHFSSTCIYWQVGTLDTLVGLSDDLGKLDGFVERYILKDTCTCKHTCIVKPVYKTIN